MRSCISAGARVPASGGRASFAQIRRQTCLAVPTNAKPGAAQRAPDFVLSELTQPCEFGSMESVSSESDAVREVRREGTSRAVLLGCGPHLGMAPGDPFRHVSSFCIGGFWSHSGRSSTAAGAIGE